MGELQRRKSCEGGKHRRVYRKANLSPWQWPQYNFGAQSIVAFTIYVLLGGYEIWYSIPMKDSKLEGEFSKLYKGLNKPQREAVDTIDGPVMVIAGPGTGKTTILTLRISNILEKTDTPASGILALTFTESGVKSMKVKLRKIIGGRADEVRIHTFHGFASSVISEFPEHFPHLSRSTQITDIEANRIIREIIKDKKFSKLRPLGDTDFYLGKIIGAISDAKKEAFSPKQVEDFSKQEIERIKDDPNSISSRGATKGELKADALKRIDKCEKTILFAKVFDEYERIKKDEYKMDFDDLLYELLNTLKNDELLLRLLQEKFLYILVDEHQDTNDSQNQIVTELANFFDNPNLFVVGDEKQAIYRFQGASVENFLKFQNLWRDMKLITLRDNYRSHQSILDATFSMIEKNYEEGEHERLRVRLSSGAKHEVRPIDIVTSENVTTGDEYLVNEIKNISEDDPEATIAVILRWNRDVDYILNLCEVNGLAASAERGVDIFSHSLGLMYFTLLEYFENPGNLEPLAFSVASGLWNLDFADSILVLKAIKSGNVEEIIKKVPGLKKLQDELQKSGIISFLILLGEISGLINEERMKDPLSSEVWRAIVELAKDIAESTNISDPLTIIKELIYYKKTAERKTIKIGSGDSQSKIQIMTAHSSKGLEFDYVFLPFALEEYWMRRKIGSSFVLPKEKGDEDEIKDTRRLFYVSVTRAKKHVVILTPQKGDLGQEYVPLRFVEELEQSSLKRISAPNVSVLPKGMSIENLDTKRKNDLHEYSKRILFEKGLSVTALNHFIECPNQFLYKSILKVPEAPNPVSEKGIAMHKAISEVWREKETDSKKIKKIIDKVVQSYFEISLLTKSEKEVILEELLQNSSKVAEALAFHFAQNGEVQTDKWLEKEVELKVSNEDIRLTLHGQMDSIVSTEDSVSIFDYKTREGMSLNAIKGETKDSDGGYFRQLIFYKILAGGNSSYKDRRIETSLVFIKPDSKGRCPIVTVEVAKEDEDIVMEKVKELVNSVYSGDFLDKKCNDPDCKYCSYKKIM